MQQQTWHTTNWGFLGWLETGLKFTGIILAFIAFAQAGSGDLILANHPRIVAVILLGLMTFFWIGGLFLRFQQREIISFVFAILNFLGHLALLIAVLRAPQMNTLPALFGAFFVAGELVKQRFLATSGYTEGGASSSQMVMVSRGVMVAYGLFALLMLI
jgi:hypothetical protein